MTSILLAVIYLAFISLGLPDSILGSVWPMMYHELQVPVSFAGIISMIIAGGTIISSLFSDRLVRKLGTGLVTLISVAMTAVALFGFAGSHTFLMLCLWAIPYGMGAGSVDAALNNFVALHYKSRHMSWLHCFWGVGATAGPAIMGLCLTYRGSWNIGYQTIGGIQIALVLCLLFSLPLWKRQKGAVHTEVEESRGIGLLETIALPGAKAVMIAFFCYSAVEATTGLWVGSYLVLNRGIATDVAARWSAMFYMGITIGRFGSGFISERLGDRSMVRLGQVVVAMGLILVLVSKMNLPLIAGLILMGIGCAPIFPSLLHSTPNRFGKELSQSIMGVQMAAAYLGTTLMPPLFGVIADTVDIRLYPFYILVCLVLMAVMTERADRTSLKTQKP